MSIGAFFTKKIGPLPVWAYGAIAAGGTFLILSSGKSKGGAADGTGSDPSDPNAGTANKITSSANVNSKLNQTISSDQTFGGGGIGFFHHPMSMGQGVFVNMFHHPDGGYFHGGRHYDSHAFRAHGFRDNGRHFGGFPNHDHFHGFGGGNDHHGGPSRGHNRDHGGRNHNPFKGGPKRGGHSPSRGGNRGRIARSFSPGSSRYTDNNASSPHNTSNNPVRGH